MKKGKLALALLLTLAMSLGLAAYSWAGPGGMGPGGMGPGCMGGGMGPGGMGAGAMGHGGMNLTPDQAGKMFDLRQKFMDDTAALRQQMCVKRAELGALWQAATPDQTQILAKDKEINALRDQLQPKMVAFKLEARKIAPQAGFGCCMGPGGGAGVGPAK
jgi:zinc resistance-associated protein